jgi:filamentous hemagglutinin
MIGMNAEANNRQLHSKERERIKELAAGDAVKEGRLTIAACALVKCYAEYTEDSEAYKQLKRLADAGATDAFAVERGELSKQQGMFGYSSTGVFSDKAFDAGKQLNNTYQVGTRVIGAGKLLLGVGGVAGSVIGAGPACATGFGCIAVAVAGTTSLDAAYSGSKQLYHGVPAETFLNQALQGLGMSPVAASWTEAAFGIGAATVAGKVASRVLDQAITTEKLSRLTYLEKGVRPDPATYLSGEQIAVHL